MNLGTGMADADCRNAHAVEVRVRLRGFAVDQDFKPWSLVFMVSAPSFAIGQPFEPTTLPICQTEPSVDDAARQALHLWQLPHRETENGRQTDARSLP
jgi:hypothetical protein